MNIKEKLLAVIPVALVVIFFSIITLYTYESYEKTVIQNNLMWIGPVFFAATLGLIVFSGLWSFKDIKKLFKFDRKVWVLLLLIFLFGAYLRIFVAPHTHRLYYDEDIYLNIGQNIAKEGRAILCNYGSQEKCFEGIYNKQPNGYPFLMSILFLFGGGENEAHYVTAILSSFIVPLIFLIAYLLFNNWKTGIFSALFFSLIPVSIRWAPTTSAGSVSILFMALAFFAFLSYFKTKKFPILLFSISSLAYAVQIRPEGFLFLLVMVLAFFLLNRKLLEDMKSKKFLLVIILFSVLLLPHALHILTVKSESWGASGNKLGLEYVENNLKVNGMFFFENTRFPLFFSILSVLGLYPFLKEWRKKAVLVVWFLSFFILYLLFYAGSFNYGVDVRFSLNLYIPLAILGGCGAMLIYKGLGKFIKRNYISFGLASLMMTLAFVPFYGFVGEIGEKAWDARLAHDFVVEKMKDMDDDCWIFTHVPSVILVNGKNSLQAWYAQNPNIRNKILENDCVLFYEEYWCNAEPYKSGPCKYFFDSFDMKVYATVSERNKNFTLYRIEGFNT